MTARRVLAAIAALAGGACGDDLVADDAITAVSGSRLMVQWYRYTDGALQHGQELYDLVEHTRCAPATWADGVVRCVPVAEEAWYVDDQCTSAIGRTDDASKDPTHFIGYDRIAGVRVPTRLYRAGAQISPVPEFYARLDGTCMGPYSSPLESFYFQAGGEVDAATLVPLHEREVGAGRVGVVVREGDDGLRLPIGLRDRGLDMPCAPGVGGDGRLHCQPTEATFASYFHDPSCAEPAIVINVGFPAPSVMEIVEPSGCRGYRALGPEVPGPLYRREGATCRAIPVTPSARVFTAGPDIRPALLADTVEQIEGRRLQRIVLADGTLRFAADELFDTATRAACRREETGGDLRCVPAVTATVTSLATPGCTSVIAVAELSDRRCERPTFASSFDGNQTLLHAIGAPVTETLYRFDGAFCVPYAPEAGTVAHAIGPALDADLFLDAIVFGERR